MVDDGSKDGTREIHATFQDRVQVILRAQNGGKGSAIKDGIAQSTGDYILFQDADLEYDPEEIPAMLSVIDRGEADVVYGSRNMRPREREGAWVPRIGVWTLTKIINVLHQQKLTDVWTCYKLFPAEAASDFTPGRFESELLLTSTLSRRGYSFAEVPISYHPRKAAEGK